MHLTTDKTTMHQYGEYAGQLGQRIHIPMFREMEGIVTAAIASGTLLLTELIVRTCNVHQQEQQHTRGQGQSSPVGAVVPPTEDSGRAAALRTEVFNAYKAARTLDHPLDEQTEALDTAVGSDSQASEVADEVRPIGAVTEHGTTDDSNTSEGPGIGIVQDPDPIKYIKLRMKT